MLGGKADVPIFVLPRLVPTNPSRLLLGPRIGPARNGRPLIYASALYTGRLPPVEHAESFPPRTITINIAPEVSAEAGVTVLHLAQRSDHIELPEMKSVEWATLPSL